MLQGIKSKQKHRDSLTESPSEDALNLFNMHALKVSTAIEEGLSNWYATTN